MDDREVVTREDVPNYINQYFSPIGDEWASNLNHEWVFYGEEVKNNLTDCRVIRKE